MVKFFRFPVFKAMAPQASQPIIFAELSVMHVIVTTFTIGFQIIKYLTYNIFIIHFEMTSPARQSGMLPLKSE